MDLDATEVIELLGGTNETARLCDITPSSVSEWKAKNEIPHARLMFLRLARPDVFGKKSRTRKSS